MRIPQVETCLPELMPFIDSLVIAFKSGELNSWPAMAERVHGFFTPVMMDRMDHFLPGWHKMASYNQGVTLVHVTSVLASLLLCPEFQRASPGQQTLMKWIVLFHDLAKEIYSGKRHYTHGFRSAAITGKTLPVLGFPVQNVVGIEDWSLLTANAITRQDGEDIQDNRQLPAIIGGIDRIFGQHTPAASVIKAVLFHMSINVLAQWPQTAPLSDAEIQQYIDEPLLPLLKIMMIVDNDAWGFFEAERKQRERDETLAVFERIEHLISLITQ